MNGFVIQLARPVTLWAVHFIAIYALISAACAPRELLEPDVMRATAALMTVVAAVVALIWLLGSRRDLARLDSDASARPLGVAAVWSAGISLMAIVANLWPVAVMGGCAG